MVDIDLDLIYLSFVEGIMKYKDDQLKKVQQCELMILKKIDEVCNALNIEYCIAYGTALGQRRHGGFIPWDDDIDIVMRREDYNKFLTKGPRLLGGNFFLQTNYTDENFPKFYAKVRLKNTKFIEWTYRSLKINHGIYVDVFPLDYIVNDVDYLTKVIGRISIIQRLYDWKMNRTLSDVPNTAKKKVKALTKIAAHSLLKLIPKKYILSCYYNVLSNYKKDDYYLTYLLEPRCNIFKVEDIFPVKRAKFNDIEVNIPANIDKYLKTIYDDYMVMPPVDKRQNHKPIVLDFGIYCSNDNNLQ